MKTVAEIVEEAIQADGRDTTEIARDAKVSHPFLFQLRSGRHAPPRSRFMQLAPADNRYSRVAGVLKLNLDEFIALVDVEQRTAERAASDLLPEFLQKIQAHAGERHDEVTVRQFIDRLRYISSNGLEKLAQTVQNLLGLRPDRSSMREWIDQALWDDAHESNVTRLASTVLSALEEHEVAEDPGYRIWMIRFCKLFPTNDTLSAQQSCVHHTPRSSRYY